MTGDTIRIVYESGTRDGTNRAVRLAYEHAGLAAFQLDNGRSGWRPRSPDGGSWVFAQPRPGRFPASGNAAEYQLAHPYGIAELDRASGLCFGDGAHSPVMRGGTAVSIALDELRAAVR